MKRYKLLSVIALTAMLTQVNNINAQSKWRLGGNSLCPGGDCLDGTNNSLGTDATANLPLNIITNGIQRMAINEVL